MNRDDWKNLSPKERIDKRRQNEINRRAKLSKLQRLQEDIWRIYNKLEWSLKNIIYKIKNVFYQLHKGYAPYEVYNYASENSKRAVILLTELRKCEFLGCPANWGCKECLNFDTDTSRIQTIRTESWNCECNKFERWKEAIDDMIFYHKCVAGQYEEYDDSFCRMLIADDPIVMKNKESIKRFRKGRYYYFRWYSALWD